MTRARLTRAHLLDNKLIKRVGNEEESILLSQISEILAVRSWKGNIRTLRLVTQKGTTLTLEGLERFDELFAALKQAIPQFPAREWTVSLSIQITQWTFFAFVCLFIIATFQGIISNNAFYYMLFGILVLFILIRNRFVPRGFRYWSDRTPFSTQLGERYRWLDFIFGAISLFLLLLAASDGIEALREGWFTDLLKIFFAPIILAWIFLVPLVHRARSSRTYLFGLLITTMVMVSIVVGLELIQQDHRKGMMYFNKKHYEKAIPYLEQAYGKKPNRTYLADRLAHSYLMTGMPKEAFDILESLAQKQGEPSNYGWWVLTKVCRQTGEWKRLLDMGEAAIKSNPDSVEAYHNAGLAASLVYGQRSEKARQYYAKYLELNPNPKETAFVRELYPDLEPLGKSPKP